MKVGLVCPYDLGRFGGVQNQVIALADWLRSAGHEPVLVGPGKQGPEGAVLVGPVTVIPANGSETPIRLDPRVAGAVAEAVATCDVVHIHEPLMPSVSLGALLRAEPPIVATLHAAPPPWVTHAYRLGGRLVRRLLRRAAVVTAVSPVAGGSIPGLAPRLIPNGIDLDLFPSRTRHASSVTFVGRPDPRKGLNVLLEAWPLVTAAIPAAELHVVGAEAGALGDDSITYHGRVDDLAKRNVLAASEVFCAPNTHGESFGIVVVEGMAAGCAVVASAIPGFVFVAGEAAALVPPGDARALAGALISVLGDAELRSRLQDWAVARVRRFDRHVVCDAYLAAYREALVAE